MCCFVTTMQLFSKSLSIVPLLWRSAAECHLQLLVRLVYFVTRHCPDQSFLLLCHRHVAVLCMLYKVHSNLNHSLFNEFLSAAVRV